MNDPAVLAIIFIVALVVVIVSASQLDKLWSKRERGLKGKGRRGIGGGRGKREKKDGHEEER